MKHAFVRGFLLALCCVMKVSPMFAQGSLTPSGPPGPSMKTLAQIEPRTAISSLPFLITNSGSYYLAGNLAGTAGQSGVTVQADNVTLDLNGFALVGVAGSLHGVLVNSAVQNFALYNGTVRGWGGDGVSAASAGNSEFERLRISNNSGNGLVAGSGGTINHCSLAGNGVTGINAGESCSIANCITRSNLNDGILISTSCLVQNNTCEANGNGGTAAGIHATGTANRIEGNLANFNNSRGYKADGIRNLIIKNSARGNIGVDFDIVANNNYGQVYLSPGTAFTNSNPWANFSSTCPGGQSECTGACVVTATDPANCGTCGNACPIQANASAACTSGNCGVICNAGYADCDGNPADGCEININGNVSNCGSCGHVCGAVANGTPGCSGGNCSIAACNPGFLDCDGSPADGCEVNINSNTSNCGSCGHVCSIPNGTSGCASGNCLVASCNAGYADCNNNPADGCEINTSNNFNNCGACGNFCPPVANGTQGCVASACHVASCNPGFADCDNNYANGCEINTNSNVNNCGTCGHVCSVPNGTPACAGGSCTIASCNAGFANCNGLNSDGCEINLTNDKNNCGTCGHVCPGAQNCVSSACL